MKLWSVWIEGFYATGEHGTASYHGEWEGETFADACAAFAAVHDDGTYAGPDYKLFNPQKLSWWSCQMFDNEADARKLCG